MSKLKRERTDWRRKQAKEFLQANGVIFQEMTPHHIKIGSVNYYPAKGTICLDDGMKAFLDKGHAALLLTIKKREPQFITKPLQNGSNSIQLNTSGIAD